MQDPLDTHENVPEQGDDLTPQDAPSSEQDAPSPELPARDLPRRASRRYAGTRAKRTSLVEESTSAEVAGGAEVAEPAKPAATKTKKARSAKPARSKMPDLDLSEDDFDDDEDDASLPGSPITKFKIVRSAGSPDKLQRRIWQALSAMEQVMLDPGTQLPVRVRAAQAMVQMAQVYMRAVEFNELAEKVSRYEAHLAEQEE